MMRSLVAGSAAAFLLTFSSFALADDDKDDAPVATGTPVVKPAQVITDPKSGAMQVVVPPGCASTIQQNGQIVVFCPGTESNPGATPAAARRAEKPDTHKWYGWQTLMVDGINHGVAAIVLVAAIGAQSPSMALSSLTLYTAGYTLGGPIVHWANGQVGKGFASLGLRVGAPVVLGLTGAAIGSGDDDSAGALAALGVIAGIAGAIAIDSAALAHKEVRPERTAKAAPKLQWTPTGGYDSKRQTFTLGLGGTF